MDALCKFCFNVVLLSQTSTVACACICRSAESYGEALIIQLLLSALTTPQPSACLLLSYLQTACSRMVSP
jgi:hypothetical protein